MTFEKNFSFLLVLALFTSQCVSHSCNLLTTTDLDIDLTTKTSYGGADAGSSLCLFTTDKHNSAGQREEPGQEAEAHGPVLRGAVMLTE